MPARRVARACCYADTRILTDSRAPAQSLSCAPQVPLPVLEQTHRPACDRVQRTHEPCGRVRRRGERGRDTFTHTEEEEEERGREKHHTHTHTHTHTQACTQALSACRWVDMPARRVARACCYAATRILTDSRAPAQSLSCSPQEPLSAGKPGLDLRAAHPSKHCQHLRLQRADGHVHQLRGWQVPVDCRC
jgi:hypothetical protein